MKRRDFIYGLSCFLLGAGLYKTYSLYKYNNGYNHNNIQEEDIECVFREFTCATSFHCNLNCRNCDCYAPLAKKRYTLYKDFAKDMEKIKKLAPDRNMNISFLGGEPTINPELTKLLKKARSLWPDSSLMILSNGVILDKFKDDFWKDIKETNTDFHVTKYPINIDNKKYEEIALRNGVNIFYDIVKSNKLYDLNTHKVIDNNYHQDGFDWSKNILDLKGEQDYKKLFDTCPHRSIVTYARGNIYYCYVHAHIQAFCDYFKVKIPITKRDYIKIANVKDIKEIDEFLTTPKPLCRFCKQCHNTCYGGDPLEWGFSEYKISEWT